MARNLKIALCGASGTGKAQPLDEPVLTTLGWKPIGGLTLKDRVIDPVTGNGIGISGIFDRGTLPIYKVTFSDGCYTRVSNDHLWTVQKKSHNSYKEYVVDTNYLINDYKRDNHGNSHYRYMIPTTKPVNLELKPKLPVHPYILGFVLGDGCIAGDRNCARVSTNIIDSTETMNRLKGFGAKISRGRDYPELGVTHFRILELKVLKELGLMGCKSKDKFIPVVYLNASIEDRKLLLAGLLDTDGSTCKGMKNKTSINYDSTSKTLAEQVVYLLRSLGETASIRSHDRTHEGKSTSYKVHCNISFNPYYREYKKSILDGNFSVEKRRNHRERRIVNIEFVGNEEARCIKVDSDAGLYITRDFIVTHNTTIAHQISMKYKIPFISGSYSDLIPSTRNQLHKDMITKDPGEIYQQDYQLLNLRRNQLKNKQFYVSDRSFIDNVAYFIDKLAHHIPRCEVDTYIDMCKKLTYEFCTHIIFIPFDKTMIDTWKIEDNNKRVTNPYFQYKVSLLMGYTIEDFIFKDLEPITVINMDHSVNTILMDAETGIKVLYLHETGMTERQKVIEKFLEP